MQQRPIIYSLQQILSSDMLGGWVDTLIGDANGLQAALGQTQSVIANLLLSPTSPASLTLNVTNGFLASLQPVDSSAYGSLTANTQQVLQLAYNQQTNVVINNTLSSGQAQYVLVEAGYSQIDSNAVVLPYVNISNPAVPYSGPSNSGLSQDTVRNAVCVLTVKYGTPATSGDEIPPTVDAGQVAVAYVDLEAAQTTITAGQILDPSTVLNDTGHGSPTQVLAGLLNAHHSGAIGQAPKIELTNGLEVQGLLPMANLLASNVVGGVTALRQGSGNPNGVLAGNSNRNNVPDTYYDYTNNAYYVCTTTGSSSTAVWTSTNIPSSHQINLKTFTTSGTYTPTVGTKYILVAVCGAGGGGGSAAGDPASGGGAGSTAVTLLPATGLTFPATITIGTGGAGGPSGGTDGSPGNNSQFSTSEIGTSLTGYAGEGGYHTTGSATSPRGGMGGGILQSASLMGTITVSSVAYPYLNIFGGAGTGAAAGDTGQTPGGTGGSSMFGGGGMGAGNPATATLTPSTPGGFGSGGGGGGPTGGPPSLGSNGTNGVCVVIEYVGN